MTGQQTLDLLAAQWTALLAGWMERVFGPQVRQPFLGTLTWADLGAALCFILLVLILNGFLAGFVRRRIRQAEARPDSRAWIPQLWRTLGKPIYALLWIYGVYLAATPLLVRLQPPQGVHPVRAFVNGVFSLATFAVFLWLAVRLTRVLETHLKIWAGGTSSLLDDLAVPLLGRTLRVIVPVVGLIFALPLVGLPASFAGIVAKGSSLLIIGAVAWILFQAVGLVEKATLAKFDIKAADNLQARKVYTQVHVLSRTVYVLICLFTLASVLMLFDEVRRFGTSILASAGVIGIIVGFAAQRTIANLFAGFQLAMTQPIRMDDVVIVENEWGRIEEITLTYVVVKIWDERRLIVPLSYFIEKPFQNWTRTSSQILGSVFLWADFTLPIAQLRPLVKGIVENSPHWDKRFWNLQVTDTTDRAMQLRILATAAAASKAWDLRCEIREKLLHTLQDKFPQALPRFRATLEPSPPTPQPV